MNKTIKDIIHRLDVLYRKFCRLKALVEEIEDTCCGGGGEAYPQVNTYADLPITVGTPIVGSIYVVLTSTGTWFWNRKEAGLWRRTGNSGVLTDWERLGSWNEIAKDGNFTIVNSSDITKTANFDLSSITTGTNRVLSFQDSNGTIAYLSNLTGGTVTSVDLTTPTGLSVTGNPITTSGTLALSYSTGYAIPTTSSQTDWDTAFTNRITSLTTSGSSGVSTLIGNTLNIPNYTLAGLGGQPLATNLTSLSGLTFASTSFVKMTAGGTFALDTNTYLTGNQSITLSGDVSGTGTTSIITTIANSAVTLAQMANLSANSIIGNNTGGAATPLALTGTQVTAMLDNFSTSSTTKGLVPGSNSVGTTYYLRADGNWAVPPSGGTPGGSNTQVQYNNSGSFGGASNATINGSGILDLTTSVLGTATFSAFNTVTTNLSIGGAATTFALGGTPTSTLTANFFTNATASGSTKTINFGTAGASGSTTTFNFGSTVSGATNNFNFATDIKVYALTVGRGNNKDSSSVAFGYQALYTSNAGASGQNVGIGALALTALTTAYNNVAVGYQAAMAITSGGGNVAIGTNALKSNQSGADNFAIGVGSLQDCTGGANTAIGSYAMNKLSVGTYNVAIGASAMGVGVTTGSYNICFGAEVMYNITSGAYNLAIGNGTLRVLTTGTYNIAIGPNALYNANNSYNIGIGFLAGYQITTGASNTIIGDETGYGITTGSYNTILGANVTGLSSSLSNNIILSDGQGNIKARHDATSWTLTGNVKLGTVGDGIYVKEGSNATMGTATLSGGTVTVSTTKVTANSRIYLTVNGGTLTNVGSVYISGRTSGTSFTITSMNVLDASDVAWLIIEPS